MMTSRPDFRLAYSSRESAFMRALIHHDYMRVRAQICRISVDEWAVKPDSSLFTLFDCRTGSSVISKANPSRLEFKEGESQSGYRADLVARESRSGGRMSPHIIRVSDGCGQRDWVIPLRRETSDIPDALKRIAANLGSLDSTEVDKQIQGVMDANSTSEIH
ncbi:hypothetical protein DFH06DRAFT_1139361 [Mycena polygramma]|nr:hypothetical protein DFH06DRAFT_1139361 [Mycena polygramma]